MRIMQEKAEIEIQIWWLSFKVNQKLKIYST